MQRIQAAHTRGDLAMITRDIVAPAPTNLGRALDHAAMSSLRVHPEAPTAAGPATMGRGTPTLDLSGIGRRIRLFVLLAVGGVFASCVLGLVAFVPAVLGEFDRDVEVAPSTDAPGPRPSQSAVPRGDTENLHTAAGWTALVAAVKAESGTTEVYDLVAYPQYASVGLDGKDAVERRFYRDGAWQESVSVRTPIAGSPVDLADIDPDVIASLPAQTAEHFGIGEPTATYIIVNAFGGDPRVMVYVQTGGRSEYRVYDLAGRVRS